MLFPQDIGRAVLDELVGPTDADDRGCDALRAEVFHDGAAEAVVQDVVLDGANHVHTAGEEFDERGVERLDPARVDDGGGDALGFELRCGLLSHLAHSAEAEDGDAHGLRAAVLHDFGLADFEELWLRLGLHAGAAAARVADAGGAFGVVRHGPEHVGEFVLILRLHVDEVWDVAEVADVEEAVVRRAVVAAEAAAVHAQADGEILQRDVMHDHVVGALHECGVDREEGREAFAREACGEERGVLLGDAGVEVARGVFLSESDEAGAARHRAGDGDELVVRRGEFRERGAEQFAVGRRGRRLRLAGLGLELAEAVEFHRLHERWLVALALRGEDVEQHWLVLRLQEFERVDERRDVVPVHRPVVAQAEILEEHARRDEALHAGLDAVCEIFNAFAEELFDEPRGAVVQAGIHVARGDLVEVARDGSDVAIDAPLVVVEDDDEFFRLLVGVVQRLVGHAAGERRVARDGDDVLVRSAEVTRDCHAERRTHGGARVACAVAVVLTLGAEQESVQALVLPDGLESLAASGENLVDVALVRDVEDELVLRRAEDAVQRDAQLDDAEVRPEMAADGCRIVVGHHADEFVPHFLGELWQQGFGHCFHVGRGIDGGKDVGGGHRDG